MVRGMSVMMEALLVAARMAYQTMMAARMDASRRPLGEPRKSRIFWRIFKFALHHVFGAGKAFGGEVQILADAMPAALRFGTAE